ncbi:MAG: hypothetical protein ACREJT_03950, partial [Myxococcota bacterium]
MSVRGVDLQRPERGRTLLLSHRNVQPVVSKCMTFEFEELVGEVDAVELAPMPARPWSRLATKIERKAPWVFAGRQPLPVPPGSRYDLLYLSLHSTSELAQLQPMSRILGLAERTAINIDEVWRSELAMRSGELEMLRRFDFVFTPCEGSVDALSKALGKRCHYLPHSIDTLRFFPYQDRRPRPIDVYFMGRRRDPMHRVLYDATRSTHRLYLFDTAVVGEAYGYPEHREHLAELVQQTKYFVVDIAKSNRPDQSGNQPELALRYYEGAAAGAVLIGVAPATEGFARLFGWENAVIPIPATAGAMVSLLDELDANPTATA